MYRLLCKDVKTELSKVRRVEGQVPSVGGIRAEGRGGHLDLAPGELSFPRLGMLLSCPRLGFSEFESFPNVVCFAQMLLGGETGRVKEFLFPKELGVLTLCTQQVDTQDMVTPFSSSSQGLL